MSQDPIRQLPRRVLELKDDLGMLISNDDETPLLTIFDDDVDRVSQGKEITLEVANDSIILAQNNDNLLPLSAKGLKIHVTGPTANSRIYQSGGWTGQWHGAPDESEDWFTYSSTVIDAMKDQINQD
jgi:beta-glucosidase